MASRRKNGRKRASSGKSAKAGKAQVPPTRQMSPGSATGAAIIDAEGTHEIPQGEDRGSKIEIVGNPKPDLVGEGSGPEGAQAEPARFTSNGQVPHNTVGSPSGPIPVHALGLDQAASEKKQQEVNEAHDDYVESRLNPKKLSPETISRLGRAELQAIGELRGYEGFGPDKIMGTRRTRLAFQKAQDEDDSIESTEGDEE